MVVVGLVGGIASGKSTVAKMLASLGADVVDADSLGHRVYEPGSACYDEVVEAFGEDVVGAEDGRIDRKKLGAKVFGAADADVARRRLEGIVWPRIREQIEARIEAGSAATPSNPDAPLCVVVEAALLVEAGWVDLVDEVWGVLVDPDCALERLLLRDPHLDEDQARARLGAQMSNAERGSHCDLELHNTGELADLRSQVRAAWEARVLQLEPGTDARAWRLRRRWQRLRRALSWRRVALSSSVLLAVAGTVVLRGRAGARR